MPAPEVHPLRQLAEAHFGRVLRDRGEGLYIVARKQEDCPLFTQIPRGDRSVLLPTKQGLFCFAQWLGADSPFGFTQFANREYGQEDARILAQGIKLWESHAPASDCAAFSRTVHRYASWLLRTHAPYGAAIPTCIQILASQDRKGFPT